MPARTVTSSSRGEMVEPFGHAVVGAGPSCAVVAGEGAPSAGVATCAGRSRRPGPTVPEPPGQLSGKSRHTTARWRPATSARARRTFPEVARQRGQIVDRRAAPAVDRLVVVADGGERVARRRPDAGTAGIAPDSCPGTRRSAHARSAACHFARASASRSSSATGSAIRSSKSTAWYARERVVVARDTRARRPRSSSSRRRRSAAAGAISAFFHWLIFHCAARARARSAVATSSATIGSMSAGSKIENAGLSPSARASRAHDRQAERMERRDRDLRRERRARACRREQPPARARASRAPPCW